MISYSVCILLSNISISITPSKSTYAGASSNISFIFIAELYSITHTHTQMWASLIDSSVGKESACNAGDPCLIPGLGRSPGEGIGYSLQYSWASLVIQSVKNLPAMWETCVRALSWEDPLEEDMATDSSILAWRILWTEEPGMLQSMGLQRVRHD